MLEVKALTLGGLRQGFVSLHAARGVIGTRSRGDENVRENLRVILLLHLTAAPTAAQMINESAPVGAIMTPWAEVVSRSGGEVEPAAT